MHHVRAGSMRCSVKHEGTEACGDTETTNSYASCDNTDTCTKGKSYEVNMEQCEQGNSPVKPEHTAMCSGHQCGRDNPGLVPNPMFLPQLKATFELVIEQMKFRFSWDMPTLDTHIH